MAEKHLGVAELSSYLDGESVEPAAVRAHLAACSACSTHLGELREVDHRLLSADGFACEAFRSILSADLDRETGPEEQALLERHLAGCDPCRQTRVTWLVLQAELKALPHRSPSSRVDRAIEKRARRRPSPVPTFPTFATGGGLAVAVSIVIAIVVALSPGLPTPSGPPIAHEPAPVALVASVSEQVVLSSATGRIYVLEPQKASVAVYDGTSRELVRTIALGGKPVSIGINETTNTVYVLDAGSKSITEIDGTNDAIVATLAVNVSGTPTSLQVDASGNRVLVTAAAANADGTLRGELAVAASGASLAVSVSQVDIAAQRVVVDAQAGRIYVAARDATLVLDASTYATLARIPGGALDLAISPSGVVAVLSGSVGTSQVTFFGDKAGFVELSGTPRAITALPDGVFAVLVETNGQAEVVPITTAGPVGRRVDAPASARKLAAQPGTGAVALVGPGGMTITTISAAEVGLAQIPAQRVDGPATPQPQQAHPAPAQPGTQPRVAPISPAVSVIPREAERATRDTYRLDLTADRQPVILASAGRRLWFIDQRNTLAAIDTHDGMLTVVAALPKDSAASWLWAGDQRIFAFDAAGRTLLTLGLGESRFRVVTPPFPGDVRGLTVTPDGRAWLAIDGSEPDLVAYDAVADSFSFIALPPGTRVNDIQADRSGRVWFGGDRVVGYYDYPAGKLVQIPLPGDITSVAVDKDGSTWAGTTSGYLLQLRGSNLMDAFRLEGGVQSIVVSPDGDAWFVARSGTGFSLGLARDHVARGSAVGGARRIVFDDLGRAWYAVGGQPAFFFTVPLLGVE